jgi:dephospho-CoA kinase
VKIALTGRMGAGKNTVADLISQYVSPQPSVHMSFAGSLKTEFHKLFPHIAETPKPRKHYQQFGQYMRRIDADIWIRMLERHYKHVPDSYDIIITDVRQQNEFDWCVRNGFKTVDVIAAPSIRVNRMVKRGDKFRTLDLSHETEMNDFETDDVIYNDGDIEHLKTEIKKIILPIKTRELGEWKEIKD